MKSAILLLATGSLALANTAPTVIIQSATMRPGTTLMDVVYRVNDPDDATVKTRALCFVDGVRSFAKVIKPVTFVENTETKLGDAVPTNVDHTLTWDAGADWNIDLGQIKFEVLAMDGRGLLPLDWINIPAAGGNPELTVSKNSPTQAEVLNALFWRYASGDTGLSLSNGILSGNASSGVFNGVPLVEGSTAQGPSTPFIFKRMNLDIDDGVLATIARAGLTTPQGWHAASRAYTGTRIVSAWGKADQVTSVSIPFGQGGVFTAISAGPSHSLALKSDGTVVGTGDYYATPPAGLSGVTAIAAGYMHNLALKSDGTVVAWGYNASGQTTIPAGLSGVTAIAAGDFHSLALKSDGTVIGWGQNNSGQINIPNSLSGVTAIAASNSSSFALKSDGTVIGWGNSVLSVPDGLTGVTAIALSSSPGAQHALALKSDGTVVGWGYASYGQTSIPAGLSGVTAIATGYSHSLALKSDGTVVSWGKVHDGTNYIPASTPAGLTGVTEIAAGQSFSMALKAKAP